ncbi:MAG: tetratricopeptide repeat protein [Bacteroidetes bacterium]|nr:tetratricopeptide repeat protein [Bacteroidota bacterium]
MTARYTLAFGLSLLCLITCHAQSAEVVSFGPRLSAVHSDTARARIYGEMAWEKKFIQNDSAWILAVQEVNLSHGDALLLADGYRTMGLVRVIENKPAEGIELYQKAISYARKAGSGFYEASCLSLTAGMYQDMGDYDRSLQYYLEGLRVAEQSQNDRMIATISNNIASVYDALERDPMLTIRYYQRAAAVVRSMKNWGFAELIAANIASEYHRAGQDDSAEIMLTVVRDMARLNGQNNYEHASSLTSMGDIYLEMGKTEDAEKCLLQAVAVMDSIKRPMNVMNGLDLLSRLYAKIGHVDLAEKYAGRLLKDATEYHAKLYIKEANKTLSDIAHQHGQDSLALRYYQEYNRWGDSVLNDAQRQNATNMQLRAEMAQRDLEVQYQVKEKTRENSNLRAIIIVAASGLLLLVLLILIVVRSYRNSQRANKLLETQKEQIERQAAEKETLMLEIHHRVKNNLQIVSSLLSLQANSISDENAAAALRESHNRVRSIALIHQKLYAQEALSAIHLADYITQLCADLKLVFGAQALAVNVTVSPEDLTLDMERAIPLGVILNELITNSIKYGGIVEVGGAININVSRDANGLCTIRYADNGVGMPVSFDLRSTRTLGMRIVNELTRQLRGTLTSQNDNGAVFTLSFALD